MNQSAMLFLITLVLVGLGSIAQANGQYEIQSYEAGLFAQAAQMDQEMLQGCRNCSVAGTAGDQICNATYDTIFNKGVVSIHLAFGYMDVSEGMYVSWGGANLDANESVDGAAEAAFVNQVLQPCYGYLSGACGFQRDAVHSGLLLKRVVYRGRSILLKIQVTHSSATPDLETNLHEAAWQQNAMSQQSERNFFGALGDADLLVYTGHARGGGGPDFHPPRLNSRGTPNYAGYYRPVKPGLRALTSALSVAPKVPSLLAVLGCNSDSLFRRSILATRPKLGLITLSNLTDFDAVFRESYLIIDGFLKQECAATYRGSLEQMSAQTGARPILTNFLTTFPY